VPTVTLDHPKRLRGHPCEALVRLVSRVLRIEFHIQIETVYLRSVISGSGDRWHQVDRGHDDSDDAQDLDKTEPDPGSNDHSGAADVVTPAGPTESAGEDALGTDSAQQHQFAPNGSGLEAVDGLADHALPATEHSPFHWKRWSWKIWTAIGAVLIAAIAVPLGNWLNVFVGPPAPTTTSSAAPIGNPGHSPGRQDVSTMSLGHRFYAVANFYDYEKCGRPCWLPLFEKPTEKSTPVTQGWPCEYYNPRATLIGPYCLEPPSGRTASERANGADKDSGDRILVICQTTQIDSGTPAQTLSNEIGQASNIWDEVAVPAAYVFHGSTLKRTLTPVPGMPGFYEAFGGDIWLGNTGWHGIACLLRAGSVSPFHPGYASRVCNTWMALASCPAR